jgi:serine/threonine-protein kinase
MIGEKAVKGLRPFPPRPFGRYTLLAPLASGGMGEVFLARQEGAQGFEKWVVIKKILPQLAKEQDFVDRFVTEAKILVKLHHGSVAQVLDMGQIDDDYYIALEFVDGKDLRKVAARCKERNHTLPLGLTLFVMVRVLDALAYAHRKKGDDDKDLNLVHRDVSPQNVLISYEGEVKVIDFGLAKSSLASGRTNPSMILGKFFYMSPEQARHLAVDRRSDLYAVGIVLYEMISGRNPFESVPQAEIISRVASPKIEPLGLAMPGVPANIDALVMKALAPDPKDRFASAEEMRGRLQAAMLELDPAAGPESLAQFMRAVFANEHTQERKVFQSLREAAVASGPSASASASSSSAAQRVSGGMRPTLVLDQVPAVLQRSASDGETGIALIEPVAKPAGPASTKNVTTVNDVPDEAEREFSFEAKQRITDPARPKLDLDSQPPFLPPPVASETPTSSPPVFGSPAVTAPSVPAIKDGSLTVPFSAFSGGEEPRSKTSLPVLVGSVSALNELPADPQELQLPVSETPQPVRVAPGLAPTPQRPKMPWDNENSTAGRPTVPAIMPVGASKLEDRPPHPATLLRTGVGQPGGAPPRLVATQMPAAPKVVLSGVQESAPSSAFTVDRSNRPTVTATREELPGEPSGPVSPPPSVAPAPEPISNRSVRAVQGAALAGGREVSAVGRPPPRVTSNRVAVGKTPPKSRSGLFIGIGLGVAIGLLALAALLWHFQG